MDSQIWPSERASYYLGILPPFLPPSLVGSRLHLRITHIAHITCVQLAGRIWGEVRRFSFQSRSQPTTPASSPIALPSHLARLFPNRRSHL
jgi:hypothetical protein